MENTFVSSKGIEIKLRPVSQFKLDAIQTTKQILPVPTYTVKTATGEEQTFALDAESAKSRDRVDEWVEYLAHQKRLDADYSKKFFSLLIWEGVDVEVPGPDSEWVTASTYFGIYIPDNPIERKVKFVSEELLGTLDDIGDLIAAIMETSGINEEAVEKLRLSFRNRVQRRKHKKLSNVTEQMDSEVKNLQ